MNDCFKQIDQLHLNFPIEKDDAFVDRDEYFKLLSSARRIANISGGWLHLFSQNHRGQLILITPWYFHVLRWCYSVFYLFAIWIYTTNEVSYIKDTAQTFFNKEIQYLMVSGLMSVLASVNVMYFIRHRIVEMINKMNRICKELLKMNPNLESSYYKRQFKYSLIVGSLYLGFINITSAMLTDISGHYDFWTVVIIYLGFFFINLAFNSILLSYQLSCIYVTKYFEWMNIIFRDNFLLDKKLHTIKRRKHLLGIIHKLSIIHHELNSVMNLISMNHLLPIVTSISSASTFAISSIHSVFGATFFQTGKNTEVATIFVIWEIYYSTHVLKTIWYAVKGNNYARRMGTSVHDAINRLNDEILIEHLQVYSIAIKQLPCKCSLGIFDMSFETVFMLLGYVSSFSLLFIQFDLTYQSNRMNTITKP